MKSSVPNGVVRVPTVDDLLAALFDRPVSTTEEEAVLRAAFRLSEVVSAGAQIYSRSSLRRTGIIMAGWACESNILVDGRRQIISILVPGDPVIPRQMRAPSALVLLALTPVHITDISSLLEPASPPNIDILKAMARASRDREERLLSQITRLGQLSAYERVVHFLLELRERLARVGLVTDDRFRMPLTQEVLADALGLSMVHVNRTLQQLRKERLIEIYGGEVALLRPQALADVVGQDDWSSQVEFNAERANPTRVASSLRIPFGVAPVSV